MLSTDTGLYHHIDQIMININIDRGLKFDIRILELLTILYKILTVNESFSSYGFHSQESHLSTFENNPWIHK